MTPFKGGAFDAIPDARSTHRVDPNQPGFFLRLEGKAAPRPIPGMRDQFSLHWIHMHVVKLLDELRLAPDTFPAGSK